MSTWLQRLIELELREPALILTHDNPDPDAVASAFALQLLLKRTRGLDARIAYSGIVGRAENRAMVELLHLEMEHVEEIDLDSIGSLALIDAQPHTGNSAVPADRIVDIVIDHHPLREQSASARLAIVRPDVGASATILTEFLREAGVAIPTRLATALLYAIKSETQDLAREVSAADRGAYDHLTPLADPAILARIIRPPLSLEYFINFHRALEGYRIWSRIVLVDAGDVIDPDFVPEMADFAARMAGIDWALSYGRHGENLYVSLRANDPGSAAEKRIRDLVHGLGSGGGHGMRAGARISLAGRDVEQVKVQLTERYAEMFEQDRLSYRTLAPAKEHP